MAKTIRLNLTGRSIGRAIREVEAYKAKLTERARTLCARLADIGLNVASVRFANAQYDGTNDASVTVEPTDKGCKIVASGNAVCFIEFGSGVHYNAGGAYPIPKPSGVSGIGQYGHGYGADDSWSYAGDPGTNGKPYTNALGQERVLTHGNPARMPMYMALSEMHDEVERIAREVFADG